MSGPKKGSPSSGASQTPLQPSNPAPATNPPPDESTPKAPADPPPVTPPIEKAKWWQTPAWWQAIFSFLLVINAVAGFFYFRQQNKNAQTANQTSSEALAEVQKNFVLDHRPFVVLKDVGRPEFLTNPQDPSKGRVVWTYHYTNIGRTPSSTGHIYQDISLGDGKFVPSKTSVEGAIVAPPVAPGGDDFASVVSEAITPAEFARLAGATNSDKAISIRLRIEYTDGSKTPYETGVCLYRLNLGSTAYCRAGNYIK